jgi:VanZ family protein
MTVSYMAFIFLTSNISNPDIPQLDFIPVDKLLHTVEYLILGFLISLSLIFSENIRLIKYWIITTILFGCFYGFTDELHQHFVPNRNADILDWLADSIGIVASLPVAGIIKRRMINVS